jgi:hypothetical protein
VTGARSATGASGCLEVLAAAAMQLDDLATAVTALAAASDARRRIGSPLNVVLRGRVQRLRRRLAERAGLGPDGLPDDLPARRDVFEVLAEVVATVTAAAAAAPEHPAAPGA